MSTFDKDQRHDFNEIVGSVLPCCSLNVIETITWANSRGSLPQPSTIKLQLFFSSIPLLLTSLLSSILILLSSRLLLKDVTGGTDNILATKHVEGFLKLSNNNFTAVGTSALARQLLRGRLTSHSIFKILIPGIASDTCHVPAESQLKTDLRNVYFSFGMKL